MISIIVVVFSLLTLPAQAAHLHKEAAYRDAWCQGETEVTFSDGSRVDCLTANYAIEVEFANKSYEALGQSIHYARISGKQPAILLIIEKPADWRHYRRLRKTAKSRNVRLWYVTPRIFKSPRETALPDTNQSAP